MSDHSKLCAIVFDEISLKESVNYDVKNDELEGLENFGHLGRSKYVANHALVFMVRGLIDKWKQPFAYYLSSSTVTASTLKEVLLYYINKLVQCGLNVRIVICDQGANNRSMLHSHLHVTVDRLFFMHNEKRIIAFYDPPHLLKNVRNNLRKSDFKFDNKKIVWQYIFDFFIATLGCQ